MLRTLLKYIQPRRYYRALYARPWEFKTPVLDTPPGESIQHNMPQGTFSREGHVVTLHIKKG